MQIEKISRPSKYLMRSLWSTVIKDNSKHKNKVLFVKTDNNNLIFTKKWSL